ncbi:MAG TPA: FUSC family protein, partial [Solirubrobacteraceae bacterium]|nr:FUSC family protein [Solirubrobacteraceae bacterium]
MIRPSTAFMTARSRLRGRMLPIVQNATAAMGAWFLATLLLSDPRPAFAAIAAVIAVGVTHGQRAGRAIQLVAGVVVGITVATLLISVIGTG